MEPTETRTCTNMLSREPHCLEWLLLEIALHLEHNEAQLLRTRRSRARRLPPPETAFERLQHERPSTVVAQLSDEDLQDMQGMKLQGWTYRELGELYGMTAQEAYGRLRYYKARTEVIKC